jgi:hypothetical protein
MNNEEIRAALAKLKADREWARVNPENPICRGCDRREAPNHLQDGLCAECRDDVLQNATGCRFGSLEPFTHEDCIVTA